METKANHLAVGSFVLVVVAGLFAFVLWLGKGEIDRDVERYYIMFTGSVSGLTTSSVVRYRGVPVGGVEDIRINPENSEQVRVTIDVLRDTPIKDDSLATLEMQGITGLVDVQISGGHRDSPKLRPRRGQDIAVIASKASALEALFAGVPGILTGLTNLIGRGTVLLSDDNLSAFGETLSNFEVLSGDVAIVAAEVRRTAENLNLMLDDLRLRVPAIADKTVSALDATETAMTTIAASADTLTGDMRTTLGDIRESAQALAGTADSIDAMIAENRPALRDFAAEGMYELSRLVVESRVLVGALTRISDRLEADPARFLFGDSQAGFDPGQ